MSFKHLTDFLLEGQVTPAFDVDRMGLHAPQQLDTDALLLALHPRQLLRDEVGHRWAQQSTAGEWSCSPFIAVYHDGSTCKRDHRVACSKPCPAGAAKEEAHITHSLPFSSL